MAALWLGANDAGRELLERSVRVIDWSHERVTPLTPFDNHFTEISNAYLAHLRADDGRICITDQDVMAIAYQSGRHRAADRAAPENHISHGVNVTTQ